MSHLEAGDFKIVLNFGLGPAEELFMKAERRISKRKQLVSLNVANITALDHFALIAKTARLVDASSNGFLVEIDRKELVPKYLRENLTLQSLEGEHIMLNIVEMDLELEGRITRTKLLKKGIFEVAIDFSEDAPEYWRECLFDLLPGPGELFYDLGGSEDEDF